MIRNNVSKSCLDDFIPKANITDEMVEGTDYISLDTKSNSELGRLLSYNHPANFTTVFGNVGTIRSLMDYITIPGYPYELLSKARIKPEEKARIPKRRISVPNFWAIVTYIVCVRIKGDVKIIGMLKDKPENVPFTLGTRTVKTELFGNTVIVKQQVTKMSRYLGIIAHVEKLIKDNRFTKEEIDSFVLAARDHKDKSVFDGIACDAIKVVTEETSTSNEA